MLDTAEERLEKLITNRFDEDGDSRELTFRAKISTVNAIMQVVDAVYGAEAHGRRGRRMILLVTLDVRNALNPIRWKNILC